MDDNGSISPDVAITEPLGPARSWGPIDSLRLVGQGAVLPLSVARSKITIGAGACDVMMPATVAGDIASHHATIVRIAQTGAICVRNRASTDHVVRTGELFYLAGVPVLATDARLETIRARLAWCIGLTNHAAVDVALEIVAEGRPIALVGPRGTDALSLARAIHAASPQCAGAFVPVTSAPPPALASIHDSTLFVDLDTVKATAPLVRQVLAPRRGLRVIFAARDVRLLRLRLDTASDQVRAIQLTPLAERGHEVLELLAMYWREELRIPTDLQKLGHRVAGLARYRWPRNFDELREQSARLLAYLVHGTLRDAARSLGVKHQSLSGHLKRIGFIVERDGAGSDDGC